MLIEEISIQNFKSFGNNKQTIKFDDSGKLILLQGENGSGKCISPNTVIDISIDNDEITKLLLGFLKNRK